LPITSTIVRTILSIHRHSVLVWLRIQLFCNLITLWFYRVSNFLSMIQEGFLV